MHSEKVTKETKVRNMEIRRDKYLNQLIEGQGNGLIKVVTGLRRSGKSYLVFKLYYDHLKEQGISDEQIIRIDLEDRRNKELRDPDKLLNYIDAKMLDTRQYYILLDEVQHVAEFEDVLNSYLKVPNADVYVTGSNSKFLSSDIVTEFRGRGDQVHIYPLSFSEYMSATDLPVEEAWKEYYTYGGLPHLMNLAGDKKRQDYLKELTETVYIKDIVERYSLRNVPELRELLSIISSAIGSPTNPSKLANTFKSLEKSELSDKTIQKYLSYFCESFIVECAQRYDIKGKKYINTLSKYYFSDMGVRNSILNYRQLEENHLMENAIYNELRYRGLAVDVGCIEAREINVEGKYQRKQYEVDFVVNQGSERVYIQSAFKMEKETKIRQEEASYKRISDSFRKIIIVRDNIKPYFDENGIYIVGLFDFLLNKVEIL